MDEATARAHAKLKHIIRREGTADGARLTPDYFKALVEEARREIEAERVFSI